MPSPSPYTQFRVGAVTQPISTTSGNDILLDADPALYYYLDFWTYVIRTYPGPRLLQAAAAAGVSIASAVAQKYPYDPTPFLKENQFEFPLLCAFRRRGMTGRETSGWSHDRGLFELVYSLPPLTAGQARQLLPLLNAVAQAIRYKTTQSFDPGYTPPGGSLGQAIATPTGGLSGCEAAGFGDPYRDPAEHVEYGNLEGVGNQLFPTLRMSGYLVERDFYVSDGNTLTGVDVTVDLVAPDGTRIHPFVQVGTQPAPTVSSLSTTSGPHAGGTSVTVTGTGFIHGPGTQPQGPAVLFGGTLATNVVWVSSTSITCATPAVSGASSAALGVTVVNPDGQSGSLANAFTYT